MERVTSDKRQVTSVKFPILEIIRFFSKGKSLMAKIRTQIPIPKKNCRVEIFDQIFISQDKASIPISAKTKKIKVKMGLISVK